MRASEALTFEPAACWRRLQQSKEFFFEDLDAHMKEQFDRHLPRTCYLIGVESANYLEHMTAMLPEPLSKRSTSRVARVLETLAVVAMTLALTGTVRGATASFSAAAPTLGSNDISNLTGAGNVTNNVSRGDPNATYLAHDRPVQGQTFTTGGGAGYQLTAVTLKQVAYSTFASVPNLTYTIRITRPSGGSALSIVASETASVPANTPGNFPTIAGGGSQGPGSGRYVTFTLA